MKILILAFLIAPALLAQSADEAIRAVMERQTADWNRGDVRAFMRGYDNSEATLFVGSSVERGYQRVLERFLSRYGTKDKMGQLTFTNLEIHPLGADYALVIGNFHLARPADAGGNSDGIFSLTFRKKPDGWKIIADHTSETH
jgi:ketosteroid isomerase-like protein